MAHYIFRRLLLILPTVFGILLLNFVVIQFSPGGPVEQMIAKLQGTELTVSQRLQGSEGIGQSNEHTASKYAGAHTLDPKIITEIERMYGFDKPAPERFLQMISQYARFDFGHSFFKDKSVLNLIREKLPISLLLGFCSTFLMYLISLPLGIAKAWYSGSRFDVMTSTIMMIFYAIPGFILGLLLILFFAGGSFWQFFPVHGLTSPEWESYSPVGKILDYAWHLTLPVLAIVLGHFASLTLMTKNNFIEEMNKLYVLAAKAKGLTHAQLLKRHVFRNAILIVIGNLPTTFVQTVVTGTLLIEIIFSLDGLGYLGFEALLNRDYPVIFATLYIYTLITLLARLLNDILYWIIDPRIQLEKGGA